MTTPSPLDAVWFERYRPRTLDEMALDPEARVAFQKYLEAGEIPHLLFVGPAGCGKTTMARMLIRGIDTDSRSFNASKDRGIEVVRGQIAMYAKVFGVQKWKTVFLDEADGLTPDAQDALKNVMEEYADQTRFILTANSRNRIIDPLQSRCTIFEFGETPLKERILILQRILQAEGVTAELPVILGFAEKYKDLRKMIKEAQKSAISNKNVLKPNTEVQYLGADLLRLVLAGDWGSLIKISSSGNFDHRQALKDMFWSVGDLPEIPKPVTWRRDLAKAVHESQWTPDPVIHFLGTCSSLFPD